MCIELGAGAGSIAAWLADHVGEAGKVIATDVEPLLLNCSQHEVVRHNLETDDLPKQTFDLGNL